jgi:methanethiol S-methyltransferase
MSGAILVFCSTLGYGAMHSLLASLRAKAAARKIFGPSADHWYRLGFNFAAGITLLPVLGLLAANIGPVLIAVPWPGWAILAAIELAALMLMVYAFQHSDPAFFMGFGQLGSAPPTPDLTTTGAYGIVRHPLYSTGLLMLWCFPILTTGTLAFDAAITLYILIGSELEERRLIVQFGEEYLRYRKKVARLIPFLF